MALDLHCFFDLQSHRIKIVNNVETIKKYIQRHVLFFTLFRTGKQYQWFLAYLSSVSNCKDQHLFIYLFLFPFHIIQKPVYLLKPSKTQWGSWAQKPSCVPFPEFQRAGSKIC